MKFHYPKIALLCISIVAAYFLFSQTTIGNALSSVGSLNYLGVFIGGMLFAYGFTAPFAVGLFLTTNPENIWIAGIIGGIGAMVSDLFIFGFIKSGFSDEFGLLQRTEAAKRIDSAIRRTIGERIKSYLAYAIAGFLIASPLPDEAGIIMLAGLTKIKPHTLAMLGFILNTIGIIAILLI